jgi:hypothetical protein
MKKLLFLLLLCSKVFATTHYLSSSTGLITNDGLNPNTATTTTNINNNPFFRFGAGDSVLFKKGDVFYGGFNSYSSGNAAANIYYGTYGSGANPIITTMRPLPQNNPWTQFSDSIWRIKIDTVIGGSRSLMLDYTPRIWLNGGETVRAKDSTSVSRYKRSCFRNADFHFIYLYSIGNPNNYYSSITTANIAKTVFDISGSNYVTIDGLDIRGGQGSAIELASCNHVEIRYGSIGWDSNKQGVRLSHSHFIDIHNNFFDSGERNYLDFVVGGEGGDAVNVSSGSTDVNVFYNTFFNYRHAAWAIEQFGTNERDSLNRIHVYNNYASSSGIDYSRGMVLYSNEGTDVVIENNILRGFPVQSQAAFVGAIIRNNFFDSTKNRPDSQFAPTGIGLQLGHSFFKAQNMLIVKNTFSNNETAGMYLDGAINNDGSYAEVQNNRIDSNTYIHNGYHPQQMYWTIHNLTDPNYFPANVDLFIADNVDVLQNTYRSNKFLNRLDTETPIYYGRDAGKQYLKTVSAFNAMAVSNGDVISLNAILSTLFNKLKIFNRHVKTN